MHFHGCFNSRASREARQYSASSSNVTLSCFNSRASREARRDVEGAAFPPDAVSIHAPHARRDRTPYQPGKKCGMFQFTRLTRGATFEPGWRLDEGAFQFTRLTRGATRATIPLNTGDLFQFTRLTRGATKARRSIPAEARFNSRASREARPEYYEMGKARVEFQFTRLTRGATRLGHCIFSG